jgi:hypothetical protein
MFCAEAGFRRGGPAKSPSPPTGGSRQLDVGAIVLPRVEPGLVDAALEALQVAAGRDGGWLDGWVTLEAAVGAKRTTDRIASVFYRYQRRNDQELPWED